MTERIYNFSAGPAVLPLSVLEEARRDLIALPGVGMSVLEISHRSKPFDAIIQAAEANIRKLANISDNYHVLFLQGGASLQFSMVPMNILPKDGKADYVITGIWSKKAMKEAQKVGRVNVAASIESENFARIPKQEELRLDPEAAYLHFTTNNTIHGTEWKTEPESSGVPLVADASSDIFSRPIDVSKYALIYAGAQKNLAPAGVTLAIVRDDMLARSPEGLPTMLDYNTHAKERSLYNTPPVFTIYVLGLVTKWLLEQGGLEGIARHNEEKGKILYDALDSSDFYRGHAAADSRSLMNVTFRLPSEELEKQFVAEATKAGLDGLKGHRSVGGCRASIYNAFPREGVEALVSFMKEFERTHG
ncbi:MAG TPA: 3-phosphoserine/phosphohydroxythreonine transaminase [Blastocatellia bacterium]|jgi:phosphoserine aminotransferase|nr:3-phosphoserine/phosphohydroxythreonine transaminase [Blastocatellia bacterium]